MKKTKRSKNALDKVYIIVTAVGLSLFTLAILFMLGWGTLNSFKERSDFLFNRFGLPQKWKLDPYIKAIQKMTMERTQPDGSRIRFNIIGYFENTLLYGIGCTLIKVYTTSVIAYLCARYKKYFIARFTVKLVIVCMLVPVIGTMPSTIVVLDSLNLYDTIWGLYFMNFNFLGMYFLIFYGVYSALPMEYSEAAFIDGASHWYVMTRVMMPLAKSTTSVLLVIVFVGFWNDYQSPLVYWYSHPTIAVGLFEYVNNPLNSSFTEKMAADVLTAIPILIIFLMFKNKMLGSMTVGGLKG